MGLYHTRTLAPGQEWCRHCTGTGRETLPSRILGPGRVAMTHDTRTCHVCGGTGIIDPAAPRLRRWIATLDACSDDGDLRLTNLALRVDAPDEATARARAFQQAERSIQAKDTHFIYTLVSLHEQHW